MASVRFRLRVFALAAGLTAICAASAQAVSPDVVVGPHGKVAGLGYGQWLRLSWQHFFGHPPNGPVCQSQRVSGIKVAMLLGGYSGKPERHSCRVAAGMPIYVNGLSAECSTLEKPPFHGNTPAQLRSCARANMADAKDLKVSIDGRRVRGYRKLISTSPVYTFRLPRHNVLGSAKRSGRSAAYGEGLLLRMLSPGNHTVHVTGKVPSARFVDDATYQVHVVAP